MSERENWLTITQAADRLGISVNSLRNNSIEVNDVQGPGDTEKVRCIRLQFGHRARRYHVDEIMRWRDVLGYGFASGAKRFDTVVARGARAMTAELEPEDPYDEPAPESDEESPRDQYSIGDYLEEPGFSPNRYDHLLDPFGFKA